MRKSLKKDFIGGGLYFRKRLIFNGKDSFFMISHKRRNIREASYIRETETIGS